MIEKPFFERIVLGHNSFFGVDHLSASRGQEREAYFANPENILKIIDAGWKNGMSGMMMSTHGRAAKVAELIKLNNQLSQDLKFYPLLPYVQKYVTAANEKGMVNVILDSLSGTSSIEKLKMFWNGAKGIIGKDIFSILQNLIKVELQIFKGLHMPAVFLHDAFTDLALALDLRQIVEFYHEEMDRNYASRAAFATKNLPLLLSKFDQWGFKEPLVMAHLNKTGFSVNPSNTEVEGALERFPCRVMAMSTLASGYLKPEEAYEYLGQLPGVESIVVGASSEAHITQTVSAIRRNMKLWKNN